MNQNDIKKQLIQAFNPIHIDVIDESEQHRSHRGTHHTENTHFHVIIVSDIFNDTSLIDRHRLINNELKKGFENQLHALKITAKTPSEWG